MKIKVTFVGDNSGGKTCLLWVIANEEYPTGTVLITKNMNLLYLLIQMLNMNLMEKNIL